MFIANSRRLARGIVALVVSSGYAAGVPDDCTQLIVGLAPDSNSMRGEMQLFDRAPGGNWSADCTLFACPRPYSVTAKHFARNSLGKKVLDLLEGFVIFSVKV